MREETRAHDASRLLLLFCERNVDAKIGSFYSSASRSSKAECSFFFVLYTAVTDDAGRIPDSFCLSVFSFFSIPSCLRRPVIKRGPETDTSTTFRPASISLLGRWSAPPSTDSANLFSLSLSLSLAQDMEEILG